MKIAFATTDCRLVDEQFRRASQLAVYELTASGYRLDRLCAFPADRSGSSEDRLRAIADVTVVYVTAIGPSSAARLAARGIRAATAPAGTPIAALLGLFRLPREDRTCSA